ncbi:double-stranded RNA-binding protein Staufen homolog 2 [Bacillus rossius redtenbacheri]|uniref:double-stranded RNA-binding protein Staufen homolog 2 n=1 Tax=Bacillus rossius redtenbacheri TaxID=93214 RepID=UPI002FDD0201
MLHQHSLPIQASQPREPNRLSHGCSISVPPQQQQQKQDQQQQKIQVLSKPIVARSQGLLVSSITVSPEITTTPQNTASRNSPVLLPDSVSGDSIGAVIQEGQQNGKVTSLQPLPQSPHSSTNCNSNDNNLISVNLANTKEKTPMCLVNELARFNKIQHQYRLTNEQGPAHKKRFTVTLKLGEEEYSAEGASIKKAQHSAASEALEHTKYKHPPPKTTRNIRLGKSNITPTVELNALAMKRGEPAVYTFLDPTPAVAAPPYMAPPPPPPPPPPPSHNYNYRGMYNQRYHIYKASPGPFHHPIFLVSLRVGAREFFGEGQTGQAARHDAAARALNALKLLPLPEEPQPFESGRKENGISCIVDSDPNSELKSPISLVHEIALKRNLPVTFEVISEKGPPHMRTFITKCSVGDKMTTGEGNGKKVSKKRAAEKMLEDLKKLPPISPTKFTATMARLKRKTNPGKKKTRNLIKVYQQEQKAEPDYGEYINPISRLIQIQQAKKEREPVYSLLEERGVPRRREFVMEVSIGQTSYTGTGPNKKLAKRAAAEGLLQQLGYSRPTNQPCKPSIKTVADASTAEGEKNRKVTFLEEERATEMPLGGSSGRQLVPGLLLMSDNNTTSGFSQNMPAKVSGINIQTTATIAKEFLKGGSSPTAEALAKTVHNRTNVPVNITKTLPLSASPQSNQVVRPKDQLLYLAQLLNFNVQFSDFPKGNHSEFLSLVSLSTVPPQVCHGAGSTTDASHDQAALTALRALSEMGLDSLSTASTMLKNEVVGSRDGTHVSPSGAMQKPGSLSTGK